MVRFKGKDQIEFGYKNYAESSYGGRPGATPTTLYKVGYVTELTPQYDPEFSRLFVLRDTTTPSPIALLRKKENIKLRLNWIQGTLGQYAQTSWLAETKLYKDASNAFYFYWTGLKLDKLTVRGSIGEPINWTAELIGKLFD